MQCRAPPAPPLSAGPCLPRNRRIRDRAIACGTPAYNGPIPHTMAPKKKKYVKQFYRGGGWQTSDVSGVTLSVREGEETDRVMARVRESTDQVQAVSTQHSFNSLLDDSALFG